MAKYSITLKSWCEAETGLYNTDYKTVIEKATPLLFNFDFPIFSEDYRKTLETKIIKYYYQQEIGFETFEQLRLNLDETLNRIIQYYNQMYEASLQKIDFLNTEDITETLTSQNTSSGNNNVSGNNVGSSEQITTGSDTPQGKLDNFLADKYLSSAAKSKNTDTTKNQSESKFNNQSDGNETRNIKGYRGYSPAALLKEMYESIRNIDNMVIEELSNLFMLIW